MSVVLISVVEHRTRKSSGPFIGKTETFKVVDDKGVESVQVVNYWYEASNGRLICID